MQAATRRSFGISFRGERERLGLTQADVLAAMARIRIDSFEGNFISKIEAGKVVKVDRELVELLIEALDTSPIRQAALMAAAGLAPTPAPNWDTSLAQGYLATVMEPLLSQIVLLARQAEQAEAKGLDHTVFDDQVQELVMRALKDAQR